jgi:TPR repeat protein
LSRSQTRFRELFGAHGLQLYDRAEARDRDAAGQVGLLLCAAGYPREAEAYLSRASGDGNVEALLLLKAPDGSSRRQAAVVQAHKYGTKASAEGDIEAALTYCRVAATQGHLGAACLAATLLLSQDDPEAAAEADQWIRFVSLSAGPHLFEAGRAVHSDQAHVPAPTPPANTSSLPPLSDASTDQPPAPDPIVETVHHRGPAREEHRTPEVDTLPLPAVEIPDQAAPEPASTPFSVRTQ